MRFCIHPSPTMLTIGDKTIHERIDTDLDEITKMKINKQKLF